MLANPDTDLHDLAIIGGGINGVGIAADAAGRGLSVFLCEQHDLASHTSSASSKLIHGGLRYLEHYEFRLVRESLAEREVLLAKAPHIVKPMRFILPHRPHLRPGWMIRAGLFLYDHLGKRKTLAASRGRRFGASGPLKAHITHGFEYSDCWVDDARLVVLNALQAREKGARIRTRTRCVSAVREKGVWRLTLEGPDGETSTLRARALVNAAGPWVARFISEGLQLQAPYGIRLIQGSHIIVPRLYDGEEAFIMQNEDRRIVFAIPYLDRFTMIGTTDQEYRGDPTSVSITEAETDYLLDVANAHFRQPIARADILASFSGVRPLCDDESDNPSVVTRDYTLSLQAERGEAPLLSVFGGKLTTYRRLAEAALDQLKPHFRAMGPRWTAAVSLPGGEGGATPDRLAEEIVARLENVPRELALRWATTYGARVWGLIGDARQLEDLGEHLGQGLYAGEVDYLCESEWAVEAEDILWRRTKLRLTFTADDSERLERYLSKRRAARSHAA